MAKEGRICTILTTNFDEFIEQALDDEAIKYRVICTNEEYREYFENGCEEFAVLKIHGTISRPETIIAVASHYKTSGGFDGYKSAVAHHFIKTVPTIFFGYSGWDFTHANYQEFWDAAGRAGGENIYFMRRKGSRGGPLLSKLVGRHIGVICLSQPFPFSKVLILMMQKSCYKVITTVLVWVTKVSNRSNASISDFGSMRSQLHLCWLLCGMSQYI